MAASSSSAAPSAPTPGVDPSLLRTEELQALTPEQEKQQVVAQRMIAEIAEQMRQLNTFEIGYLPGTYVRDTARLEYKIGKGRTSNDQKCAAVLSEIITGTESRIEAIKHLVTDEKIKLRLRTYPLSQAVRDGNGNRIMHHLQAYPTPGFRRTEEVSYRKDSRAWRKLNNDHDRYIKIYNLWAQINQMVTDIEPITPHFLDDTKKILERGDLEEVELKRFCTNTKALLDIYGIENFNQGVKRPCRKSVNLERLTTTLYNIGTESSVEAAKFLIKLQIDPRQVFDKLIRVTHGDSFSKEEVRELRDNLRILLNFITVEEFNKEVGHPGFLEEMTEALLAQQSPIANDVLLMIFDPIAIRFQFEAIAKNNPITEEELVKLFRDLKKLLNHITIEEFEAAIGKHGWFGKMVAQLDEKTRNPETFSPDIARAARLFTELEVQRPEPTASLHERHVRFADSSEASSSSAAG